MNSVLSHRGALDVLTDVFRLAFHPVAGSGRMARRTERVYHLSTDKRAAETSAFSLASEIASFNQGAIIEYVFMLAEKHKKLRQATESGKQDVQTEFDDLIKFMNKGFFSSIYGNFVYLLRHFHGRSSVKPRIAVLGNWKTEDRDQVITIFRDKPVTYSNIFPLDESSALTHCARTGTHFICNDIVYATLNEGYRNPRLNHRSPPAGNKFQEYTKYRKLNKAWHTLWNSGDDDPSSVYKSTLVLPISIDKGRLNADMIERFDAENAQRLIFGYLCIDHRDADYFDEEIDVPVARMVSDIISIFSFQRLRFTDYSSTFSLAESMLNRVSEGQWLRESVEQIIEAVSVASRQPMLSGEFDGPGTTVLMTADEILLRSIEDSAVSME